MMYLVHKQTKEHRRYEDAIDWRDSDCQLILADANGWIEWRGDGECPLPDGALHEVKSANGEVLRSDEPEVDFWGMRHGSARIIAYRPILDAKPGGVSRTPIMDSYREAQENEAPAWSGEGLPPVGCECELLRWRGGWDAGKVLYVGDEVIVMLVDGKELIVGTCNTFRPIRSKEDRAVEEMRSFLNDTFKAPNKKPSRIELCRALYRAGYRKTGVEG